MRDWLIKILNVDLSDKKPIWENYRFYVGIMAMIAGAILIYLARTRL